jgi:hypothetical protein
MKTHSQMKASKRTAETSEKSVNDEMQEKLLAAKKRLDEAKEMYRLRMTVIRKAKRTITKAPERVEKLQEQIARAKSGTTQSLEKMLKQAKEMEEKAAALKKEAVELDEKAKKISESESDLRMELAETRKSNRSTSMSVGGGEKSFKLLFVKTLQRRTFVIKYDVDGAPIGAERDGIKIDLDQFDAVVNFKKNKVTLPYSQGQALRHIDDLIRGMSSTTEEKSVGSKISQ